MARVKYESRYYGIPMMDDDCVLMTFCTNFVFKKMGWIYWILKQLIIGFYVWMLFIIINFIVAVVYFRQVVPWHTQVIVFFGASMTIGFFGYVDTWKND